MDWSPILISMRTAGLSIVFTFFMGILAAWMVVRISHSLMKTILDGIFTREWCFRRRLRDSSCCMCLG